MTKVYFLISLIVVTDGVILYCKYIFDRPNSLDKELKPDLIIGSDYWDLLVLPLIFVLPFVWLQGWTETIKELYFLPFLVISILTVLSLFLALKYRLKRYYLTDNGIVILSLFTNQILTIPIDTIKGYSYRQGYRSAPSYLVASVQKRINISVRQIKNIQVFIDYFKRHNIQYYEYDWLTGNDYKK
ncbi:MAG TPA: hypothetical protein PK431_17475 [Chitinophagales bacterium]|nr:hypothetical protein [Chitinophagales bacterium]